MQKLKLQARIQKSFANWKFNTCLELTCSEPTKPSKWIENSDSLDQRGFTLVELLLYMGIFSILLVMLFQIFASIFDVQLESKSVSSVTQDGLFIQNRLNYDASRTKSIVAPALGQSSESLSLFINNEVYTYSITNGNLNLSGTVSGTLGQLNSEDTSASASFTRLSDTAGKNHDTITVSYTLTSKTIKQGIPNVENFRATLGLRPKQ